MNMTKDRVDAIVASAYNVCCIGPYTTRPALTPKGAAALSRGDRAALIELLRRRGSSLYTESELSEAFDLVTR